MLTLLGDQLRYLGDKELARSIITGTFDIPVELDPATTLILKEIGKLGLKIMNREGKEIIITPEEFTHFWKTVGEITSLLSSGVHCGHFKATIQDPMCTRALALQLTVIACSSMPPESWSMGLQVMLVKIAGVCLAEKLRVIQIYEADLNCFNHFIFGRAVMEVLTKNDYLPEELFS